MYIINVQVTNVANIIGKPFFIHRIGVMAKLGSFASFAILSEMVTIKTLAVEHLRPILRLNSRLMADVKSITMIVVALSQ